MSKSVHPQATCSLPYFVIMTVFFEQQIPNINNVCGRAHLALSLSHTHIPPSSSLLLHLLNGRPAQLRSNRFHLLSCFHFPHSFHIIPCRADSCRMCFTFTSIGSKGEVRVFPIPPPSV